MSHLIKRIRASFNQVIKSLDSEPEYNCTLFIDRERVIIPIHQSNSLVEKYDCHGMNAIGAYTSDGEFVVVTNDETFMADFDMGIVAMLYAYHRQQDFKPLTGLARWRWALTFDELTRFECVDKNVISILSYDHCLESLVALLMLNNDTETHLQLCKRIEALDGLDSVKVKFNPDCKLSYI